MHGTLEPKSYQKCGRFRRFLDSKSVWFRRCFLWARNAPVTFAEKPQMKINSLKKQKHGHLIHTWSDKAFRFCKSGILIFAWRATWNYAYSPFNFYLILYSNLVLKIISAYWNSVEFYTNFLHCKIFFP